MGVFEEIEKKQKEIEELQAKAKAEKEEKKQAMIRTTEIVGSIMKECYHFRKLNMKAKMESKILEKITMLCKEDGLPVLHRADPKPVEEVPCSCEEENPITKAWDGTKEEALPKIEDL